MQDSLIHRIGLAVGEHRLERGLSLREVARYAAVSRATLTRLEGGHPVRADLAVRIGLTLVAIELFSPPAVGPLGEPLFDNVIPIGTTDGRSAA